MAADMLAKGYSTPNLGAILGNGSHFKPMLAWRVSRVNVATRTKAAVYQVLRVGASHRLL